jgi:hypothetical protein
VGYYVEPRAAGIVANGRACRDLVWDFPVGLFGTFIGLPIALAMLSFCYQHPSSRWLADLLGGPGRRPNK